MSLLGFDAVGRFALGQIPKAATGANLTSRLALVQATIVSMAQPPPSYVFMGGGQPHAPKQLSPALLGVRVDNPPFSDGGPVTLPASLVAMAQPNPWVYLFSGARQPYNPRTLPPSLIAVQADNPPVTDGGPIVLPASIIVSISQPNPWTYTFFGGRQPFEPKNLSIGIIGTIDFPQFSNPGRLAQFAEMAQVQPNPWVYLFLGGAAPFLPRSVNPAIPGYSADPPPFSYGGPFALKSETVTINQPDWGYKAWPYVFMGARQPYAPRTAPPAITAVAVNTPPFGHRGRTAAMRSIRDRWNPPPFDFQMTLYASQTTRPKPSRFGRPTARGYIIY